MTNSNLAAHQERDPLHDLVRGWFHDPYEGPALRGVRRRWGTYWSTGMVYPAGLRRDEVVPFLEDLRAYFNTMRVTIVLDNREEVARLGPVLEAHGCAPAGPDLFLAHGGPWPPAREPVPELTVEPLNRRNLRVAIRVRREGFRKGSEPDPAQALEAEIQQRRLELQGPGAGLLARMGGEPAGMIWWYLMPGGLWINLLTSLPPFRRRGIAEQLLRRCAAGAGRRTPVINVMEENQTARRLYRRLGFDRVVYRRWRYTFTDLSGGE